MARMNRTVNGWPAPLLQADLGRTCPAPGRFYRALELTAPKETRVVILGQDPYHSVDSKGNCKANGLAFGINPEWAGPRLYSSMQSIFNEVVRWAVTERPKHLQSELFTSTLGDVELFEKAASLFDFTMESWARQGVLLLNTRLSVAPGQPMSHAAMGWEPIVQDILQTVPEDAVWLLWGAEARKVADDLRVPEGQRIETSHPCKYSADRPPNPFIGSDCFTLANLLLQTLGKKRIEWL